MIVLPDSLNNMVYQNNHSKTIFEELKLLILQGFFKPRERLLERALADRFGSSRTPVREALRKLESIGMIKIVHNQGAQVADFSVKDIDKLLVVRIDLERLGAKLAIESVTSKEIERLQKINSELHRAVSRKEFLKMVEYDQLFHRYLTSLSKNEFLIGVIEELRAKAYPITYYIWKNLGNVNESLADHQNIIDALRKKKEKKLLEAVELQLTKLKEYYLAAFPQ
jgi:DNA-binding GntR family transcriptional regulator